MHEITTFIKLYFLFFLVRSISYQNNCSVHFYSAQISSYKNKNTENFAS